jgi:hypothetical protein
MAKMPKKAKKTAGRRKTKSGLRDILSYVRKEMKEDKMEDKDEYKKGGMVKNKMKKGK